jgi:ubiquitin-protein ligase
MLSNRAFLRTDCHDEGFVAELTKRPVDGFSAGLIDDSNLFEWQVTIIGPPDTL